MTSSADEPAGPSAAELARQLAALREQAGKTGEAVASAQVLIAAHRSMLAALGKRLDDAGLDTLAARFDQLAETVEAALDAAAPRGPAAPRWDGIPGDQRDAQLAWLREWVRSVLRPGYIDGGGCYALAECWADHEVALWELGTVAVWWRFIYARKRPDTALALEWHDRWLPGAMRRIEAATRGCQVGHMGGP